MQTHFTKPLDSQMLFHKQPYNFLNQKLKGYFRLLQQSQLQQSTNLNHQPNLRTPQTMGFHQKLKFTTMNYMYDIHTKVQIIHQFQKCLSHTANNSSSSIQLIKNLIRNIIAIICRSYLITTTILVRNHLILYYKVDQFISKYLNLMLILNRIYEGV